MELGLTGLSIHGVHWGQVTPRDEPSVIPLPPALQAEGSDALILTQDGSLILFEGT